MNCNCKSEMEERLAEAVKKQLPEGFTEYSAGLQGYSLILSDPMEERFSIKIQGECQVPKKAGGTKRHKIDTSVLAGYCPFCGEPAKSNTRSAG